MFPFPRALFVVLCFALAVLVSQPASAQSTLLSLTSRRGMVFDKAGQHLYVSTSAGAVKVFNVSNGKLSKTYSVGTSLNGIDIATDDSFLLVAENNPGSSQGAFYRVNLPHGHITSIAYPLTDGEGGAWDVAIGSNGVGLVTSQFQGSGWVPLRQIDLATNAITPRTDAPGSGPSHEVRQNTPIRRSADRTRMYVLDDPAFTYNATTNAFSPAVSVDDLFGFGAAAVSRDGTILATVLENVSSSGATNTSLDSVSDYGFLHSYSGLDSGVAFDAVNDIFYAIGNGGTQIIAFDTKTFKELFRMNIGETVVAGVTQFDTGTLVASQDGHYLALETPSGIRLFNVANNIQGPAPTLTSPSGMVFDHSGKYLYIATSDGHVWPFNLLTRQFETPYTFDGSIYGIDIAPDDSFLIAAQGNSGISQGVFQKMDLHTAALTNLAYPRTFDEDDSWGVALTSNGTAFGTTRLNSSGGSAPLQQINLSTGTVSARSDIPSAYSNGKLSDRSQIFRSADGTRLCILEPDVSNGPFFTYSAVTDTFNAGAATGNFEEAASIAVNRNGSLLGTRLAVQTSAALDTVPSLSLVHSFTGLDSGVAFDAVRDRFYGVNSLTGQIIGYDTNDFTQKVVLQIGEDVNSGAAAFGPGTLVASPDGRYLALRTPTTTRVYLLPPSSGPTLQVANFARLSDGHVIIQAFATPNTTTSVSQSSSLTGTFTTIGTAVADGNGFIQFEDTNAGGLGPRFYKITSP